MKVSRKAALLSAFLFPGMGHLYLKRYGRGLGIMFFILAESGYVIWSTTVSALHRLDDAMVQWQGGTANPQEIPDMVGASVLTAGPHHDFVIYTLACLWIFAVIDAYRIGRQRESRDEEASRP